VAAFRDAAGVLMRALAAAAADNASLSAALAATPTAGRPDPELHEFAAVLAEFYRCGTNERALGLRLLRDVLAFVGQDGGRRASPDR